jgi:NAD(P)H-flavin reductase
MLFVVAARKLQSFYMHAALCRLALFPNVAIIPVVSEPQHVSPAFRIGRPTDFLPELTADDVVYTSGAPVMTNAVARLAREAGAVCHADPFVPHEREASRAGLMERIFGGRESARKESELQRVA